MFFTKIAKDVFGLVLAITAYIGTYIFFRGDGAVFTMFLVFLGGLICIIRNIVDAKLHKHSGPLLSTKSTYLLDFGIVSVAFLAALIIFDKMNF